MSTITRTYTFTDGTTAYGSQVESEISNIVTTWNNHDAGTSSWTALAVTGNASITGSLAVTGALTLTGALSVAGGIANHFSYRRPNLVFISVTTVDVENNTGTANQTTILFPDGTFRSVTEDTSSTNKYRRFIITAAAEFTSGTEDSGLRSGISEATNTWYAIYAVKSSINSSNFVLSGDTTLPLQANFATLNSRYGTNGWIYLGIIRNGNNSGATGDICDFTQSGNQTQFKNAAAGASLVNFQGTLLVSATSGSAATYTYSSGTGTTDIPGNIKLVNFSAGGASTDIIVSGVTSTAVLAKAVHIIKLALLAASDGLIVSDNSATRDIFLSGFCDSALGVGPNTLL